MATPSARSREKFLTGSLPLHTLSPTASSETSAEGASELEAEPAPAATDANIFRQVAQDDGVQVTEHIDEKDSTH